MIVQAEDLNDPIKLTFIHVRPGHDCLYCGHAIEGFPYVVWQGSDGNATKESTQVGLHPQCAQSIGACLISDGTRAAGKSVGSA